MAMMNNIGDSESAYRTPLRCLIGGPWCPFSIILEDSVDSRAEIYRHHFGPNPLASRSSNRNGHDSVSNALEISSFNSSVG
jgi:hypothetical protein